jgi:hypothetical protein
LSDPATLTAAWVEAGATVVAVGAAIYAGVYAKKAYDTETERDRQRDNDRQRAQADSVAAWCDRYDYSPAEPPRSYSSGGAFVVSGGRSRPDWNYYLRNASDVPVYDVVVLFRIGEQSLGTDAVDVLPPGEAPVSREVPEHVRTQATSAAHEHGEIIRCVVSFRDAAGRRWRRWTDGRLAEEPDEASRMLPDANPSGVAPS